MVGHPSTARIRPMGEPLQTAKEEWRVIRSELVNAGRQVVTYQTDDALRDARQARSDKQSNNAKRRCRGGPSLRVSSSTAQAVPSRSASSLGVGPASRDLHQVSTQDETDLGSMLCSVRKRPRAFGPSKQWSSRHNASSAAFVDGPLVGGGLSPPRMAVADNNCSRVNGMPRVVTPVATTRIL
jgi:hypothetical protein